MADKNFYIWLAGFIDGEGTICIEKDHPRHQLVLAIPNTHKKTIDFISKKTNRRIDSYVHYRKGTKPCYKIRWFNNNAICLIKQILPFLITKKYQALIATKYMKTMPNTWDSRKRQRLTKKHINLREKYRLKMRELNKRGFRFV